MRWVSAVARLIVDARIVVLVAFIFLLQTARELFAPEDFLKVFADVPLAVAEQRDARGLWW
ncbi:Adenylyl-sulfate kinase [compost metagenome]|jgi:adenylylsulfate kinase